MDPPIPPAVTSPTRNQSTSPNRNEDQPCPDHNTTTALAPRPVVSAGDAALDFYARAFDSKPADQIYDGDRLVNGHVLIGSTLVGVTEEDGLHNQSPSTIGGTPVVLSLTVPDADEAAARFVEAGGEVVIAIDDGPMADAMAGSRIPSDTSGSSVTYSTNGRSIGGHLRAKGRLHELLDNLLRRSRTLESLPRTLRPVAGNRSHTSLDPPRSQRAASGELRRIRRNHSTGIFTYNGPEHRRTTGSHRRAKPRSPSDGIDRSEDGRCCSLIFQAVKSLRGERHEIRGGAPAAPNGGLVHG